MNHTDLDAELARHVRLSVKRLAPANRRELQAGYANVQTIFEELELSIPLAFPAELVGEIDEDDLSYLEQVFYSSLNPERDDEEIYGFAKGRYTRWLMPYCEMNLTFIEARQSATNAIALMTDICDLGVRMPRLFLIAAMECLCRINKQAAIEEKQRSVRTKSSNQQAIRKLAKQVRVGIEAFREVLKPLHLSPRRSESRYIRKSWMG